MSPRDRELGRLGQLYGIDPSYRDFWGRRRRLPVATVRALLGAMGVAVDSERDVTDRLREAQARPWRRMLAPVRVIGPPAPLAISFTLPARLGGATTEWTLRAEDGSVREGELIPDEQTVLAAAEVDGEQYRRWQMLLPAALPLGYHELSMTVRGGEHPGAGRVIVAPPRCHTPPPRGRGWGLAAQLYGVRSARNWGMGDFTDLAALAERAAALGAGAIGVNPLHALFPADPNHISPYSPSSRLFLNVLYLDPEAVPDLEASGPARSLLADPGFRAARERLRGTDLVDYPGIWRSKLRVLELLFESFRAHHLAAMTERARSFRDFRAAMGRPLQRQAVFDALHEHVLRSTGAWSWHQWPDRYRHPDNPEVAAFALAHRDRVDFFAYLQWLADRQLAAVQARARAAGMAIGLYQDIAVAVNPASAMTWANPGVSLRGASAGAPPDLFNPNGQNWVLSPLSPVGLRESAYAPFAAALRHNMRHAGAVRIDHVMGLKRLFWIPEGAAPADGAYVRYPFDELVRIIALESQRHRCLVIGEDLGTVPRGFRPAMRRAGLLSCRVLYFERGRDGAFLPAAAWPRRALVSVSTHDLPTFRGYWTCRDVRWRESVGRSADDATSSVARAGRAQDRRLLLHALASAGLLPAGVDPAAPPDEPSDELVVAVHRFLAATRGYLLMVQLEDAAGEEEQPNLPGIDEHPNWRRKLHRSLEELPGDPLVQKIAAVMAASARSGRR